MSSRPGATVDTSFRKSGIVIQPDMPICQTDLPLDWYQEAFKPYAEEYLALPDRRPETVFGYMDRHLKPALDHFGDSLLLLAHFYMGGEIVKLVERYGDDHYRIVMAVAGYGENDLSIEVHNQTLIISGKLTKRDEGLEYLHRGISEQDFSRKFQLAEYVKVADAHLEDGLLTIDLERIVPEEMKPRKIRIETGTPKSLAAKAKKMLGSKDKAA